jgi:hypothetical protein
MTSIASHAFSYNGCDAHFMLALGHALPQGLNLNTEMWHMMGLVLPQACHKRNVHKRSLRDIQSLQLRWEDTPATYTIAAAASLLDGSAAAGDADDGTGKAPTLHSAMTPPMQPLLMAAARTCRLHVVKALKPQDVG